MNYCKNYKFFITAALFFSFFMASCSGTTDLVETKADYLLKCGSLTISFAEFSEELELKKAAYPYSIQSEPDEYTSLIVALVDQLCEEIVLRRAAADRGITISEKEVQEAEIEFRKDFPEDSFESMLIENAVSYTFWKRRLGIKLVMERFIEEDLKEKIEITPGEIIRYYNQHKKMEKSKDQDKNKIVKKMNEMDLIVQLRMEKAENEYSKWIKTLGQNYPVKINQNRLKNFLKNVNKTAKE
ncbi:MAG: hypothetical protein U9N77_00510 [Thermodesulfobacteriota bacterium]|nr:hypothetical protein [Thermodesulfobacteriota bacterium]